MGKIFTSGRLCLEKGNFFRYKLKIRASDSQKTNFIKDGQGGRNYGCNEYKNDTEISFEDISYSLKSAEISTGVPEFIILGWY